MKEVSHGRVAQAFDLAATTRKVGAPLFAHFAKGGNRTADTMMLRTGGGRAAQPFVFAATTRKVGAPLFAFCAKGGDRTAGAIVLLKAGCTTSYDAAGNTLSTSNGAITYDDEDRRVARAFDLADTTKKVGAPLFAFCAKGGNRTADTIVL